MLILFGCIYAGQDIQLLVKTPLIIHYLSCITHPEPHSGHHQACLATGALHLAFLIEVVKMSKAKDSFNLEVLANLGLLRVQRCQPFVPPWLCQIESPMVFSILRAAMDAFETNVPSRNTFCAGPSIPSKLRLLPGASESDQIEIQHANKFSFNPQPIKPTSPDSSGMRPAWLSAACETTIRR